MSKKVLLSITLASFLVIGCSNESKEEVKEVANTTIDKVAEVTNTTAKKATEVVEEVKKEVTPVVNNVVEKSKEVIKSSQEVVSDVTKSATDITKDVKQKIHEATAPKPSIDGKALYARCGACHGQNGEKKALNASAIIQGWSKEQVYKALDGYQDGSYGGNMKGVMLGQVKNLSDTELEALAVYISSL